MDPERTISTRTVYEGRLIKVRVDQVALESGHTSTREIVEHPGAVAIVALKNGDEIVLVRQYRKAIESLTLEIPAGTLEPAEDPLACAARELKEETGYGAKQLRKVCSFYSAVGFCTELMHLFLAQDLQAGAQAYDDDESIDVVTMPVAAAAERITRGEIVDAKTVAGILWARLFLSGDRLAQAVGAPA